jgi:hypothetical protein
MGRQRNSSIVSRRLAESTRTVSTVLNLNLTLKKGLEGKLNEPPFIDGSSNLMDMQIYNRIRHYERKINLFFNHLGYHERINEPYYHKWYNELDKAIVELKKREEKSIFLRDRRNVAVENSN